MFSNIGFMGLYSGIKNLFEDKNKFNKEYTFEKKKLNQLLSSCEFIK